MTNSFLYRMPAGIPGDVTRKEVAKIEPQIMGTYNPLPSITSPLVTSYGVPVTMLNDKLAGITAINNVVYGFLVRPYPTQAELVNQVIGESTPSINQIADVLRSGYMTVKCLAGTAVKGGQVYVRWGEDSGTQGSVEAVTSGDQVAVTGAFFMGVTDNDGNVEICYNI